MTVEAYKKRVNELKEKNIRCMHLDFRGQEPMEYVKIDVFEGEITRECFHWDKNGKLVDWQKTFIFELGGLCGIEASPFVSQKLSKYSYLSKSNLYRLLPSGNKEHCTAEYEFDAEIRGEETVLKDEVYNLEKPENRKFKNTAQERLVITQLAVLGRSKADTGSHKRGIIKMLKLPPAKPDLVGVHVFCFRCVPDMSNPEVRRSYLESQNPVPVVYGAIEHHKSDDIVQPAEKTGSTDKMDVEMCIDLTMRELSDRPAIHKLAGLILKKKIELEAFREYIDGWLKLDQSKQVSTMIQWIPKVETVEEKILKGDLIVQMNYLKDWGVK